MSGITAVALSVVFMLALDAKQDAPKGKSSKGDGGSSSSSGKKKKSSNEIPDDSGSGVRIVYSISLKRVWIVDSRGEASAVYSTRSGTLKPSLGSHKVESRRDNITGDDGSRIESVLYFERSRNGWIAMSAQQGLRDAESAPRLSGGGIRLPERASRDLWKAGTIGSKIVVVK
ncbi:hypothetical protein AB0I84_26955 [Streptomyces spectabilis]|uniref:hypothetical protein n=1 Tax=Streptomyces spectabilis TaxID=68270 RepID=UPI0033F23202